MLKTSCGNEDPQEPFHSTPRGPLHLIAATCNHVFSYAAVVYFFVSGFHHMTFDHNHFTTAFDSCTSTFVLYTYGGPDLPFHLIPCLSTFECRYTQTENVPEQKGVVFLIVTWTLLERTQEGGRPKKRQYLHVVLAVMLGICG